MTPEERDIIRDFLNGLAREEEGLQRIIRLDRVGIAFRTAINELGWYDWNYRQQEPTEEQEEQYYLLSLGVSRLVLLAMQIHGGYPVPALTFRRGCRRSGEVLSLVTHLGFIQHGRRVSDAAFAGFCDVARSAEGRFEFILPAGIINHGAVEDDVTNHFSRELVRFRHEWMQKPEGRKLQKYIDELHAEKVFVCREHFMGYNGNPFLDEHYFRIAWSDLKNAIGFDSFNELREFGGISYLKYTLAAAFVNSLCIKHEAFCRAMVKKHPEIRVEDILTISADRAGCVTSIRDALNTFGRDFRHYTNTSVEEAERIYETIAITPRNADVLNSSSPTLPCVIEFAKDGIIKCLSGRHQQMEFLLKSLKHTYPREYDSYQQLREGSFQTAVEGLLQSSFPDLETRRNIRLRKEGRELTDVDLAVIDRRHGYLLLVQLKFQDSAANDFRANTSRMARFREESMRWLDAVSNWLDKADEQTLRSAFRIPRGTQIKQIRKLVLGRHHAWSLRSVSLDSDTSFASWNQMINIVMLMEKQQGDFRTLGGVHTLLRKYIVDAPDRHHRDQTPVEYTLENLKFSVGQIRKNKPPVSGSAENKAS